MAAFKKYRKFLQGIGIIPKSTNTNTVLGELEVLSTDSKIYFHNGTINDPIVQENTIATLTNKTLTAPVINNQTADNITNIAAGPLLLTTVGTQDLNLTTDGGDINLTPTAPGVVNIASSGGTVNLGGFTITGTDIFATTGTSATFQHVFDFDSGTNTLSSTDASQFNIFGANNQDINIDAQGSGNVFVELLEFQGNSMAGFIFDSATNSIGGASGSDFLIQSQTGQNLILQALGTGIIEANDRLQVVNPIQYNESNDSTTTGANQDVSAPSSSFTIFTNSSLTSIRSIVAGNQGQILHVKNDTTGTLTIVNEAGAATAANRITTGTGTDLLVPNTASITLIYDTVLSRWSVLGFGSTAVTAAAVSASNSGHTYLTGTNVQTQLDETDTQLVALTNLSVKSKTTTYVALVTDDIILVDASGGSWTLSLYTAVGNSGRTLKIKRTDQTLANAVTIDANGTQTIDGGLTKLLNTQYESFTIISDGSNWHIVDHEIFSGWSTYTPTLSAGFGTTTSVSFFWQRIGTDVLVRGNFITGTTTTSNGSVSLPTGLTIMSSFIPISNTTSNPGSIIGKMVADGAINNTYSMVTATGTSTTLLYAAGNNGSTGELTPSASVSGGLGIGNTKNVSVEFKIPINNWEG